MTTTTFRPRGPKRFAHQKAALRRAIETRGVCAFLMDPGTGKTASTIDYASLLALKQGGETRVLVLAPLAAIDTWVSQTAAYAAEGVAVWAEALGGPILKRAEAMTARAPRDGGGRRLLSQRSEGHKRALALRAQHADGTPSDVTRGPDALRGDARLVLLSLNLDSFANRRSVTAKGSVTTTDRLVRAVERFAPDLIVVDESHRIKSPSSNTSRAVARLTPLARRRLILTGTVMPHSPLDVWAQWRFLDPEAFHMRASNGRKHPMPFSAFKARYAETGGYMGREVVGFRRLDEMSDVMERNAITVKKADALDLPPTMDVPVEVTLSPREASAYRDMHSNLAASLASGALATVPNRLAQMMRLRQITSGFLVDGVTGVQEDLGTSKAKTALSIINDTLAGEKRVVVFCHFVSEVAAVAAGVKGGEALVITGGTPAKEREALRRRFGSNDPKRLVLIAQMRTLSLAVNELVTATHAVFLSLSERRDDWVQARDRLDRLGQTGERVTFWNLVVPGTVDEAILTAHRDRTSMEHAVLAHLKEQPL